jgi:hypothetical protein
LRGGAPECTADTDIWPAGGARFPFKAIEWSVAMKRLTYIALCLVACAMLGGCGDYYHTIIYPESQFEHANQ